MEAQGTCDIVIVVLISYISMEFRTASYIYSLQVLIFMSHVTDSGAVNNCCFYFYLVFFLSSLS